VKTNWRIELPLILLVAAMFAGALVVWPAAPDRIPVHWGFDGHVDRYGGKVEGLLGIPLITLAIYLLMRFLPRIDPGRANYARFGGAYTAIRAGLVVFMAAIYGIILASALSHTIDVARVVPVGVGALFVLFGSVLGKIRPNWFVGVRTPWTMSSKMSWVRTHRLGGWLFMALGLLFAATGVFPPGRFGFVVAGAVIAVVIILFVYSYFVWKADPEKQAPAGTQPADDE
jgi:uncharacterized membrane protein